MGNKKYISPVGTDLTDFIKTDEDIRLFEEMCRCEERTKGVLLKDCIEDVVRALQIDRQLRGDDPNTVVLARTQQEGLAKLQAYSRINLN